jgi:hypothetical protein
MSNKTEAYDPSVGEDADTSPAWLGRRIGTDDMITIRSRAADRACAHIRIWIRGAVLRARVCPTGT